jgi:alpha-acetolactate decarboxylase
MRKVLFKKWVNAVRNGAKIKEGTNCYIEYPGYFLAVVTETLEGGGSYTMALIENEEGYIEKVDLGNMKFVDKLLQDKKE